MNEERRAMQMRQYRRWQKQRNRNSSYDNATVPASVPSDVENEIGSTVNMKRGESIPPFKGYNIIDSHIYTRLRNLWKSEAEWWSQEERRDFIEWVPGARITERQNSISNHELAIHMRRNRPNWGHFVILRAMFGASQCARQSWWKSFKHEYERAVEDAPPGVVPRDVEEILQKNRMDSPPIMNIPTMEVEDSHVDEDCRCSWCLEHPAIARRKNEPESQGNRVVRTEPQLEYSRGQRLYTGEGESHEDRVQRKAREPSVEPEETLWEEGIDEKTSELMIQVPSIRERMNVISTDLSNSSLREMVIEQGGMIEMLVQLLEKQHKRTEMLAAKVEKVKKGLKKNKRHYRDISRKVKSVRKRK
ncbi:hypothetical protein GGI43DRAFT_380670 [Trichoderma evansii]